MKTVSKLNQRTILGFLGAASLIGSQALAGTPMMVNPAVSSRPGAPASSSIARTGSENMTVRLINSCYGTNLRGVSNPLSPSGIIEAKIQLGVKETKTSTAKTVSLSVKYPGIVADKDGITKEAEGPVNADQFTGPDGMSVRIFGNTVEMSVPMPVDATIKPDGTSEGSGIPPVALNGWSFNQTMASCEGDGVFGKWGWSSYTPAYPCGAYMGKTGPLTTTFQNYTVANDNSAVEISVAFPGQTGFCGGYYSPLMLFFDDARPAFNGKSGFKLSMAQETYWVEANHAGYFLSIDRNYNGKIDGKEELFGDQDSDTNGFDSLKEIDSNKDGVVDAKDKKFKRLLLWQDKNGDGKTDPGELEPAHKRVSKISLSYRKVLTSYGSQAEARQVSQFWYKDGAKTKAGMVEDIWFAPIK